MRPSNSSKEITQAIFLALQIVAAGLSSHMLLALEVAVEFWLALSWSPQAQWLSGSGSSSALKEEVRRSAHSQMSKV